MSTNAKPSLLSLIPGTAGILVASAFSKMLFLWNPMALLNIGRWVASGRGRKAGWTLVFEGQDAWVNTFGLVLFTFLPLLYFWLWKLKPEWLSPLWDWLDPRRSQRALLERNEMEVVEGNDLAQLQEKLATKPGKLLVDFVSKKEQEAELGFRTSLFLALGALCVLPALARCALDFSGLELGFGMRLALLLGSLVPAARLLKESITEGLRYRTLDERICFDFGERQIRLLQIVGGQAIQQEAHAFVAIEKLQVVGLSRDQQGTHLPHQLELKMVEGGSYQLFTSASRESLEAARMSLQAALSA